MTFSTNYTQKSKRHCFGNSKFVPQPGFTCSKLTIEAAEHGMKSAKVNNEDTQVDVIDVVVVSLLLALNIFHT